MQELPPGFRIVGQPQTDPIIAPPDPYKQADNARDERRLDLAERSADTSEALARLKVQEMQDKQAEKARALQEDQERSSRADETARTKLISAVGKLAQIGIDANDNNGWFETGTSGAFARTVFPSGTAGPTLAKDLETVEARFAFDALQAMRDASKTGGALGQVTERELDLLRSATAAIDPNMDHETFMRNVEEARQAYLSKLAMVDPEAATRMGYNPGQAEEAWNKYNDAYARELGYDTARPDVDRTPGQQSSEALPPDIEEIMRKYGARQ